MEIDTGERGFALTGFAVESRHLVDGGAMNDEDEDEPRFAVDVWTRLESTTVLVPTNAAIVLVYIALFSYIVLIFGFFK